MSTANDTFHGMKIVSDRDCLTVKGHYVVEVNSSGNLVCRYYDKDGLEEDDPREIDIAAFGTNPSESNITGSIKRQVGKNSVLISKNAIKLIKLLVSASH